MYIFTLASYSSIPDVKQMYGLALSTQIALSLGISMHSGQQANKTTFVSQAFPSHINNTSFYIIGTKLLAIAIDLISQTCWRQYHVHIPLRPKLVTRDYRSLSMPQRHDEPCPACYPPFEVLSKLRSLPIDLLLLSRTNQTISRSEIRSIGLDELLSDGEIELFQYQHTIKKLQETIKDLSNQRDVLKHYIQCAKSLSAPIRRLPSELLANIFIHNGTINNIGKTPNVPALPLTHVSSHWRSVALSTPALWRDICIGTTEPRDHPRQIELVQHILTHSSTYPLYVHIVAIPGDDPHFGEPGRFDRLHPAIPLLFDHVARWQALSILDKTHRGPQQHILDALSPIQGRLTGLSKFVCTRNAYISLLGDNAKSLRMVTIGALKFTESHLWSQINDFEVAVSCNSQIIKALPHLANETTLRVRYPDYREHQKEIPTPTVHPNIFSLYVTMKNDYMEENAVEELMDMLTLPNLRFAEFINEGTRLGCSKNFRPRWPASSIPSLFERSKAPLTCLSLTRTWVPGKVLLDLLENLPTLKKLKINEPPDAPSAMLRASVFHHLCTSCHPEPLVPKLQNLQLAANHLSSDLQDLFVDVLRSRCLEPSPDTPNKVARLHFVKLTLRWGSLDAGVVDSLTCLKREGCLMMIKDQEGDISVREYADKDESDPSISDMTSSDI